MFKALIDSQELRRQLLESGALRPGEHYTPRPPERRVSGVLRLDAAGREAAEVRRHEHAEVPDFSVNGRVYVLSRRGEPRLRRPRAFR